MVALPAIRILAQALLLAASAGKDDGEATDTGPARPTTRATVEASGICGAWGGEQTADRQDVQGPCQDPHNGSHSDTARPGGAIATCATDEGFDLLLTYEHHAASWDITTAHAHCGRLASCQHACVFEAP